MNQDIAVVLSWILAPALVLAVAAALYWRNPPGSSGLAPPRWPGNMRH